VLGTAGGVEETEVSMIDGKLSSEDEEGDNIGSAESGSRP
jgi:hypothetical protein